MWQRKQCFFTDAVCESGNRRDVRTSSSAGDAPPTALRRAVRSWDGSEDRMRTWRRFALVLDGL